MFRQASGSRLLAGEVVRGLLSVSHGQGAGQVEVRSSLHDPDQFRARDLRKNFSGALRLAHVAAQQPGVGLADASQRLARQKVEPLVLLEARVRKAPT